MYEAAKGCIYVCYISVKERKKKIGYVSDKEIIE